MYVSRESRAKFSYLLLVYQVYDTTQLAKLGLYVSHIPGTYYHESGLL